ncbi:MAG: hypothetical protein IPK13_10030 [Deltaproteobacteria bacterium]|nr:hypothetical protein [Deltaproteobacteria bacterium]
MPRKNGSRPARARGVELEIDPRPAALIALTERFAQFRAESERGTRVPAELRAAALAALRQGAAQGALQRDCQISRSQLDAWRRAAAAPSTRSRRATGEDARIFAVVDEALPVDERAAAAEPPLELRVGPWSVTVRLAGGEPGQGGR